MVDGGGLENHPIRLYQDGYILPICSAFRSPLSRHISRNLTSLNGNPITDPSWTALILTRPVPFRPVSTRSLHSRLHMQPLVFAWPPWPWRR